MSEFLTDLAARALRPSDEVQPQHPSRFEPGETVGHPGESRDFEEGQDRAGTLVSPRARTPIRAAVPNEVAARIERLEAILPPPVKGAGEPTPLATRTGRESSQSEMESEVFVERVALDARPPLEKVAPFAQIPDDQERRSQRAAGDVPAPVTRPIPAPPRASIKLPSDPAGNAPFRDERRVVPIAPPPVAPLRTSQKSSQNVAGFAPEPGPRVVQITIGRVEIRAATPAPIRQSVPSQALRAMTLDEFLDKRAAGDDR